MAVLPPADWTRREDLAALVAALGVENVRWVGGCVRDTLLGCAIHDIDAATPLVPHDVVNRLEAAGIRSVPTGIAHGTVTALLGEGPVEITTLRRDVSTDGRRATVAFSQEWRDDAARRDFTINALYARPDSLEIDDWFGGIDDLAARRVRFIGEARERIREDHLRILRYYRFQARFGSALDAEAEDACADLAPMLRGLSRERVGWELQNLLALPDPAATVARMQAREVLPVVLPEAGEEGVGRLAALIAEELRQQVAPDPLRRLAALLPPDSREVDQVAARLRLSNAARQRLANAAGRTGDIGDPRALAYRLGHEGAIDRLLLTGAGIDAVNGWEVPIFPLKGGEIVARGVTAGPKVAQVLQAVEARWVAEGFPARERVEVLVAEELAK